MSLRPSGGSPPEMTTIPGSAAPWRRAARFGVSPTTACLLCRPFADKVADDHKAGGDADRADTARLRPWAVGRPLLPLRALPEPRARPRPRASGASRIGEHAIAHQLGGEAFHSADLARHGILIGLRTSRILGIEPSGQRRRAHEVHEHHCQLAAPGCWRRGCGGWRWRGSLATVPRAMIASSSCLRWPSDATPISLRSSLVSRPSSSPSMSLARNSSAYWAGQTDPAEPTVDVQDHAHGDCRWR